MTGLAARRSNGTDIHLVHQVPGKSLTGCLTVGRDPCETRKREAAQPTDRLFESLFLPAASKLGRARDAEA